MLGNEILHMLNEKCKDDKQCDPFYFLSFIIGIVYSISVLLGISQYCTPINTGVFCFWYLVISNILTWIKYIYVKILLHQLKNNTSFIVISYNSNIYYKINNVNDTKFSRSNDIIRITSLITNIPVKLLENNSPSDTIRVCFDLGFGKTIKIIISKKDSDHF